MAKDQKQEETVVMQYFVEKYPAFPKGKLIQAESTDFILKTGQRHTIGIELTRIISPSEGFLTVTRLFEEIDKIIRKKNDKLRIYNEKKFNKTWLVIACDDLYIPGNRQLEDSLSKADFSSGFDKVFLFDLFSGRVWEVEIIRKQKMNDEL